MYTIGQVSELFQLPISTLRYYDKEGLFPEIKRSGGIRHFDKGCMLEDKPPQHHRLQLQAYQA